MTIEFLLLLPFILIFAAAPIAATILGWVAVAQIRRSNGRRRGLGLAVFDGLLFPLLALDAMIVGGVILGIRFHLIQTSAPGQLPPWTAYWWLVRREHPRGFENPLSWVDRMVENLDNRHRLNDEQKIRFLVALHGDLRIDPVARMREGDYHLSVWGECRYIWRHDFLGYSIMNAPLSVTVNGEPVKTEHNVDRDWSVQNLYETLYLYSLPPGTHRVEIEVLSALASKQDLASRPHNAPPADWPPARKRWTRTAEVELVIHPHDAVIVSQTTDPALDPLRNASLAVNPVLIRSRGDRAQAVLHFSVANTLPVPISFDVTLRAGDQTISFGSLWAIQTPTGSSSSGTERTVEVDRLPPNIRSADVVLTPNPKPVERHISFDQIWGCEITFRRVRLIGQDLGEAARANPIHEPLISGFTIKGFARIL